MTRIEQEDLVISKWREDPLLLHKTLSRKKLWSKQEEILKAARLYPKISVRSGNTVGKTTVAATIVIDWLFTNYPSKVITTSASWSQVEDVLWKEIRSLWMNMPVKIKGDMQKVGLYFNDDHFAMGISTDTPVRFQGRHSPNLLVLIDEASGIEPDIWDMIEALHPKTVIALGNPLEATGRFAECFTRENWHKITVSCEEAVKWQNTNGRIPGLVTAEWVREMCDLHGLKSAWYRVHVLGLPPEQDEFALIERQWVDRARKGIDCDGLPLEEENEDTSYRIIPCDVASKHGSNETVIGYRYGHTFKDIKGFQKQTQTFIRDQIQSSFTATEANIVVFDSDGLGEPMAELMSEVHVPSLEFHGGYGQKAIEGQKYRNLRSQFYWVISKKFEKGLYNLKYLPDKEFDILRSQLCSIRVKAPDAIGRFQIETKEDLMARQIKSPDYADCFMMSEYAYFMRRMAELRPHKMGTL